jgi:hypothetical protein
MVQSFSELIRLGEAGLLNLWRRGVVAGADDLSGWLCRGWNTSRAAARSPVGGRAFAKGFFRVGDGVRGCNFVTHVRNGEWRIDTRHPFGFFAACASRESASWRGARAALLLDYSRADGAREAGGSLTLRIVSWLARPLQDLIVRPLEAADGLYVGRAFLFSRLKLPLTCFALERWRPLPPELSS